MVNRGKYSVCKRKLVSWGIAKDTAEIICANQFLGDNELFDSVLNHEFPTPNEELLNQIIGVVELMDKDDGGCVSRKISIITKEHPDWSHEHVTAASIGWCKSHGMKDAIIEKLGNTGMISRAVNLSNVRFSGLIRMIQSMKALKVGGMGILPFKTELPMKNLNRLQTKLEKLTTLEQQFLTQEQLAQRSQYAAFMKKSDSTDDDLTLEELTYEFLDSIAEDLSITKDEAFNYFEQMYNELEYDNFFVSDAIELEGANTGLNNIIKVPVIMAREMIQKYKKENGDKFEFHFKPYSELAKAIKGINKLPIVIEHQKEISDINTIGYIKELRVDSIKRAIKGMAYFYESKLPESLVVAIRNGVVIPVSIGFFAKLGNGGIFNSQKYDFSQRDIILDHLAVCLSTTPRCPTGYCGINLDSENEEIIEKITILNKGNYIINICNLMKKLNENEKIIKKDSKNQIIKDETEMENEPHTVTKDIEAFISRLTKFLGGDAKPEEKSALIDRILNALKKKDSEEEMDETLLKELKDSLEAKNKQIEQLQKQISDSKDLTAQLTELELLRKEKTERVEKERLSLLDSIKSDKRNKMSEELLSKMSANDLGLIRLTLDSLEPAGPSYQKPAVIPKGDTVKKEDSIPKVDLKNPFPEVQKQFVLSTIKVKQVDK